jgi:hypothetical protein
MMEKSFSIPAIDGKQIYGVLHVPSQPTTAAVIIVHGLTGNMNEYLHLTFARSCVRQGIAVIRFNQYDDRPGARRLHDSTISLHVADTKSIISYAKSGGLSNLALIGHSLGGPVSIAACTSDIKALLLWDPTASPRERILDWETFDREHNLAYLDWQMRIILGKEWIEDARTFPDSFNQIAKLNIPIKIVRAELGGKLDYCKRYSAAINREHDFVLIPNADHVFAQEGAIDRLLIESTQWLSAKLLAASD